MSEIPAMKLAATVPGAARADSPEHRALRKVAHELEAVFLRQLFAAMREATPESEFMGSSEGEKMFTQMFHDELAGEATLGWDRGLSEALYQQLARHLKENE